VEALANQKVANMLKDAEDRIDAARTEASSKKETVTDTLEQNVARDIIGDTIKKLVGIDVSAEDVNEAISLTLKGRGR
jgi:vacuolar-type H+-ATPase subunit H